MIRLSIDMNAILQALHAAGGQEALDRVLMGIAESTRDKWSRLAGAALFTTRQAYLMGLSQAQLEGPGTASIELVGELANALERGKDPFSLAEGLLSSPNARRTADGARYSIVPLRMTTPGTRGAVGQPMDRVYAPPGPDSRSGRVGRDDAEAIGKDVYKRAKRLQPGQNIGPTGLPKLQEKHAVDPFTRMHRSGAAGHRYYVAFRTVSDRNPGAFTHPGFVARNFAQAAADHASKIAPAALAAFAQAALAGQPPPSSGEG